jgi:hypothetical protein
MIATTTAGLSWETKQNIDKLNSIVIEMNAVVLLNDFVHYRNKNSNLIFQMKRLRIQIPKEKLVKCQNDIYGVGTVGSEKHIKLSFD